MSTNELSIQAKKAYDQKRYQQAAELFMEAANQLGDHGDPLMRAELQNNSSVAWLQAGEAKKALHAANNTDIVFAESNDLRRQAMALGNQAAAYEALGSIPEAMERYQCASEILKEINEDDLRAYVLQNLAALQLRSGDQFQSIATMHTALENKKKLSIKERFLKKVLQIPFKMHR